MSAIEQLPAMTQRWQLGGGSWRGGSFSFLT